MEQYENLRIIKVGQSERSVYERFLAQQQPDNLMQDYLWGEFKRFLGDTAVHRYLLLNQQEILGSAQMLVDQKQWRPFFSSLFRGPVMAHEDFRLFFIKHLSGLTRIDGSIALQWETDFDGSLNDEELIKQGWKKAAAQQPARTAIVNVDQEDADLMAGFKPKTRYNIRLAQKKGVKIDFSREKSALDDFWPLLQQTAERQGVSFYPRNYFSSLHNVFSTEDRIVVGTARLEGQPLGALLLIFQGNTAYYLYGGTSTEKREVMANYLLHYEAMLFSRSVGAYWYDFWGVALPGDPMAEKWRGITRFKQGFQGNVVEYPPARSLIIKPGRYRQWQWVKRLMRG